MMKKAYLILLIISYVTSNLSSQSKIDPLDVFRGDVQLTAKHYSDSIVLRWGFDHPEAWYYHKDKSINVYRKDITAKEQSYTLLDSISPWDSTKIETYASTLDDPGMTVLVLENLYRNWENSSFSSMGNIVEVSDNFFNRWSLVHFAADRDAKAANAAGLRFVDNTIEKDHIYSYKIKGKGAFVIDDYHVVINKPIAMPIIYDYTEKDSLVEIYWEKLRHENLFSAYYFEESVDGSNWNRIDETPYVQAFDASIENKPTFYTFMYQTNNEEQHYFRIIGLDAFGDLSPPSSPIFVQGKDKTPPPTPILHADTSVQHLAINLNWQIAECKDLSHYDLERSFGDASFTFANWAGKDQYQKLDEIVAGGLYRYRLIAVDSSGNKSYSDYTYARGYDLSPPAPPTGFTGVADTNGIITLTWDEAADGDVVGYYIYYADGKKRNFTRLNGTMHRYRFYRDSISTKLLNAKRYYTIVAVDNNLLLSEQSNPIEIDRPDIIPPSPALISDYLVSDLGIKIKLQPSSSRDVVTHQILRKEKENQEWKLIKEFVKVTPEYLDTSAVGGTSYYYRFVAIDKSGLISKSVKDIFLTARHSEIGPPILTVDSEEGDIQIRFQGVDFNDAYVQLYRSKNDGPLILLTKQNDGNSFVDTAVTEGDLLQYYARTVTNEGRRSSFSQVQKITSR